MGTLEWRKNLSQDQSIEVDKRERVRSTELPYCGISDPLSPPLHQAPKHIRHDQWKNCIGIVRKDLIIYIRWKTKHRSGEEEIFSKTQARIPSKSSNPRSRTSPTEVMCIQLPIIIIKSKYLDSSNQSTLMDRTCSDAFRIPP